MGELKMEEMSLPVLFEQARNIYSSAANSNVDQLTLKKGCEIFCHCDEMIARLGLFSSNETKDDVGTANLKYLLVPFYLGELTEKITGDDRMQMLRISRKHLKEFIASCEVLELVPEDELETHDQHGLDTSALCRDRKIARFKRQREAESKLQELKERKERRGRSTKAAALSSPSEDGGEDVLEEDGEEEREAWLNAISVALCKAFDLLEMLKKEEDLLSAVKEKQLLEGGQEVAKESLEARTRRAEAWHREAATRSQHLKPAEPITCATFAQDVIEGRANISQMHDHKHQPVAFGPASLVNGRLMSERERMAAQVFQPGYRLPTMSIEEAGLREMKMMKEWQDRNARYLEEVNSTWYRDSSRGDDDSDEDDAAAEKARAWDDWKDDNPRGTGNKKLTPCG